jgi:hypothetical protein
MRRHTHVTLHGLRRQTSIVWNRGEPSFCWRKFPGETDFEKGRSMGSIESSGFVAVVSGTEHHKVATASSQNQS